MDIGGKMKKIFIYIIYIILLFLISIMPTSAKEIKSCTRTPNDMHVRKELINENNKDAIFNTPCVDEVEKVYDFGDLLTDEEETNLYNEIQSFVEQTNYDLAVVTINENPKQDAMNYADDFYDYNEFGKGTTRDGLLLLIDMDTRELYISTTGNAIKMYSDARINDILDTGYDYITNQQYYNTFLSMIKKSVDFYSMGFPEENKNIEIDEIGRPIIIKYINYRLIAGISVFITLIVTIIFYNISKLKLKVGSTISYLKSSNISLRKDKLINSIVTHHVRNTDSSGGGSHSGGSSFHTSSSGSFHGGGGRHF